MLRYRLDDLGWFQFECLTQSLLKARFGVGIQSWGGRGDHGRDAFFRGTLEFPRDGEIRQGPFIFQAKFIEEANAAGAKPRPRILRAVKAEIENVKKRRYLTGPSVYVLLTNVRLSPKVRKEIIELLKKEFSESEIFTIGGQDLCDMLDNFPNIRTSFPQLLGLRDLDALLTAVVAKPVLERSKGMIEEARELTAVFYPTEAFSNTILKLTKHKFAVLEGPPEVGKTAIARMIALSRLSLEWEALECLRPDEFFQLYSTEKPQIFIADDAFGSTEYDPSRTNEWSYNLDRILRRLDTKHWLIWTARKHILEIALERIRLQGQSENFPEPGSVLVDAGELTKTEKAMILYRHAKAAGLENDTRELIKEHAKVIVLDKHFTPERIRRFVSNTLSDLISQFRSGKLKKENLKTIIKNEIKEPTKSLKQAFHCLPEDHKRLLISRLDLSMKGFFIDENDLLASFERHRPSKSTKSYEKIEKDLLLSFLKSTPFGEDWIHPSIRDLVIEYLTEARPERHHFLSVCSTSGVSLAMSVGGGSEGTRKFPLIIESDDMDIIKSRIGQLIKGLLPEKIIELLTIAYESKVRSSDSRDNKIINFIDDIFEMTLNGILKRWTDRQEPLNNQLLSLFYKMAKLAKSFLPSPPLEASWNMIMFRIEQALIKQSSQGYIEEFPEIEEAFEFIDIIEEEDPRFLKYIDFPNCFSEVASKFLRTCISEAESDYSISADEKDLYGIYIAESEKFESLLETSEKILNLDTKIETDRDPDEILALLKRASEYYKEQAEEYFFPEPDYDDAPTTQDEISINALFSDL